jgi:hypothetical protein
MTNKTPVIVGGRQVGKFKASWLLFKETWRFLMADKELLLLPVISITLNLLLLSIIVAAFAFSSGLDSLLPVEGEPFSYAQWGFIFCCYVVGAFSLALGQAGISHTVFARAHGGDATLSESLKIALSHAQTLFLWSIITSTVGLVIQFVSERSSFLGKLVTSLLGAAWSVLTYFVVPAMVIDKKDAFASISTSGQVFKKTWGETFISNISLTLVFLGIHIFSFMAFLGFLITSSSFTESAFAIFITVGIYLLWVLALVLISSTMNGILKTLLYIYASEQSRPVNFNRELLGQILVRSTVQNGEYAVPLQHSQT